MFKFKDKKAKKHRGSKTHGYGSMKKNRGAGHRGGRGNAGSGKRGDAKKPTFQKATGSNYLGRHGFKSIYKKKIYSINLTNLSYKLDELVEKKKAEKKGDSYSVNLTKIGFDKILGTGKISKKVEVTVDSASEKATQKIEDAGGKVNLPSAAESTQDNQKQD